MAKVFLFMIETLRFFVSTFFFPMLPFLIDFLLLFISLGLLFLFSKSLLLSILFTFALLGLFTLTTIIKFVYIHVRVVRRKWFLLKAFLYSSVRVCIPLIYRSNVMVNRLNLVRVYSSGVLIVFKGFNMLIMVYTSSMLVHPMNLLRVYGSSMLKVSVRVGLVLTEMLRLMVLLRVHPLLMMVW